MTQTIERRSFLRAGAIGLAGLGFTGLVPAWARSGSPGLAPTLPTLSGEDIRLRIANTAFTVGGRTGHAVTMNGVLPAPMIRLREGKKGRLYLEQQLDEDSSLHWNYLIVPFQLDGV